MRPVEDVRLELEKRTASRIYLGRFAAILELWINKISHKDISLIRRKLTTGVAYLNNDEAQEFIQWAEHNIINYYLPSELPKAYKQRWYPKIKNPSNPWDENIQISN